MLSLDHYRYLDGVLRNNRTCRPRSALYAFDDGHVPIHRQCQVTAVHLETKLGWGAQLGIQWLDKGGRLVQWPHVVNWVNDELFDFSHPIREPKLGFTLIGSDVDMFHALSAYPDEPMVSAQTGGRSDLLAQRLHEDWFARLARFPHVDSNGRFYLGKVP